MGVDISAIPKTETHLHLEGAIRAGTHAELRRKVEPSYSLEQSPWRGVDYRLDSLGHETATRASVFEAAYKLAGDAGLGLRAHAGEGAGPESVWDAIRSLGVFRIAHGTRAIEDPVLMDYLTETGIMLDMCSTSNYRLRVVYSLEAHPIRRLFDADVRVTVSSDDPLFLKSDVSNELALLQDVFDFKADELCQLARSAIDGAFVSPEKRTRLHRTLRKRQSSLG